MNDTDTTVQKKRYMQKLGINEAIESLSLTGKFILYTLVFIFALSAFTMLIKVNNAFLVEVPIRGGTHTEGVIGLPQFINPLLSVTDADKDLTALIYSGLMRKMPDGTLAPDLAENYTISQDGLTYTFNLKRTALFQDGTPVTADDVIYTVNLAQNQTIKSIKQANWQGISVTKVDDQTIKFTLRQPYAPFIENTTLGILPKHLWNKVNPNEFSFNVLNTKPVGSGPYKLDTITKNSEGVPISYELVPFAGYTLGEPLIAHVNIKFYLNEKILIDAYSEHAIDSVNSISPDNAVELEKQGAHVVQIPLPRVFAVFFNQNQSTALAQKEVRQALDLAVDRNAILLNVLRNYGEPLHGPVPLEFAEMNNNKSRNQNGTSTVNVARVDDAKRLLEQSGWVPDPQTGVMTKKIKKNNVTLAFTISTSDVPELKQVADILKSEWQKIGAQVTIKVFESGSLNQSIIKPRVYEALLFGQVIDQDLDLYAFWHSSQMNDPGLNIALYSNTKADSILNQLRVVTDYTKRTELYNQFEDQVNQDIPAIFLYSPHFIYVIPPDIQGFTTKMIGVPEERFSNIYTWYKDTENVWKIFIRNKS